MEKVVVVSNAVKGLRYLIGTINNKAKQHRDRYWLQQHFLKHTTTQCNQRYVV
jgi:hypothetical protein